MLRLVKRIIGALDSFFMEIVLIILLILDDIDDT